MDLQKAAQALTGWLQLKTSGRNPSAFSDSVIGTIDVADNYLLQGELAVTTFTGTNLAIGSANAAQMVVPVPANKAWRVLSIGVDLGLAAADAAFISDWFGYVSTTGADTGLLAAGLTTLVGNPGGGIRVGVFFFPRPLLITPGMSLRFFQRTSANATVAAAQHAYVLRQEFDF